MSDGSDRDGTQQPDDPKEQERRRNHFMIWLLTKHPEAAVDFASGAPEGSFVSGLAIGMLRGHREGLRRAVLGILSARGLALSPAGRTRLDTTSREDVLDTWVVAAMTAASGDDALR